MQDTTGHEFATLTGRCLWASIGRGTKPLEGRPGVPSQAIMVEEARKGFVLTSESDNA